MGFLLVVASRLRRAIRLDVMAGLRSSPDLFSETTCMASVRQQVLIETHSTRVRAGELLKALQAAQAEAEQHMARAERPDVMKAVTGRSAMDNAIASTKRMIEALDRAVEEARKCLSDEDMDVLDEPDEARGPTAIRSPFL